MKLMPEITIENFVFWDFKHPDLHQQNPKPAKAMIQCSARSHHKKWIYKNEEDNAQAVVNDIGKWEKLLKFAADLGLVKGQVPSEFRYYTHYNPEPVRQDGDVIGFRFKLDYDEIMRRSMGTKQENESEPEVELLESEIIEQMTNIQKWRNFQEALGLVVLSLNFRNMVELNLGVANATSGSPLSDRYL